MQDKLGNEKFAQSKKFLFNRFNRKKYLMMHEEKRVQISIQGDRTKNLTDMKYL